MIKPVIVFSFILLISGCANNSASFLGINKKPDWLVNPYVGEAKGKIAAVGCSLPHVKGESAQKKLAVERAISSIARQKQSTVNSISYSQRNNLGKRNMDTSSLQETKGINVSTKVLDYYTKPNREICAWVMSN